MLASVALGAPLLPPAHGSHRPSRRTRLAPAALPVDAADALPHAVVLATLARDQLALPSIDDIALLTCGFTLVPALLTTRFVLS
jgi:hypothetical protein